MDITLQPQVLRWARERAALNEDVLGKKVGTKPERVMGWERTGQLSFSQAQKLAKVTYTPFGYLYLQNGRGGLSAEVKYRYLKWKMNRLRRKFDVYSGGRSDWDRKVH